MFLTQGQSGGQEKHQDIPKMLWSLTEEGRGDSHLLEGKLDTKLQRLWFFSVFIIVAKHNEIPCPECISTAGQN